MSTKRETKRKDEVILQQKSDMLDEVNKLLDLMAKDKKCLHQKIANLESQLEANTCTGKRVEKMIQTDSPCEAQDNAATSPRVSDVLALVMNERAHLKEMETRVDQFTSYCNQERGASQAEIERARGQLDRSETSLRKQTREMKTLETRLAAALRLQADLKDSNTHLSQSLEETRMKYMKTRTSLLAIRGRRSMDQKRLNKAEEDKERKEIMNELGREQQMRSRLQQQLQAKDTDIENLKNQVANKEDQLSELGHKYEELRLGVEGRLDQLSEQLTLSRGELDQVKSALKSKQEQLGKTQLLLQEERKRSVQLLTQSRSTVTQLTLQLEKERKDHEEQLHRLTLQLTELKTQQTVELDRVRDVSARRCKELAREVWSLKQNCTTK